MKNIRKPIRILIADDHPLVLRGIEDIFRKEKNFNIVCHALNGKEALHGIEIHKPDLAILDIMMPELNGIDVVSKLRSLHNELKIIFLTMYDKLEFIQLALELNVNGYILKDEPPEELIKAVYALMDNSIYYSSKTVAKLVNDAVNARNNFQQSPSAPTLTLRERQVLHLISKGHTSIEIAKLLTLGKRTIETHRKRIMGKLQAGNTALLISKATEFGFLKS
jgi:DNA-binding NarL/FixJ family response regulator